MLVFFSSFSNAYDFDRCGVIEVVLGADSKNGHVKLDCEISIATDATEKNYFAFDRSTESGKQVYSLVLMAFASDAKISGWVDNNVTPAWLPTVSLLNGSIRILK